MTFVSLTPDSTLGNSGAVTGASAHAALSDSSDSTYVQFDVGEGAWFSLSDLSLPAGGVVVLAQMFMRVIGGPIRVDTRLIAGSQTADAETSVYWATAPNVYQNMIFGGLSDADVDGATISLLAAAGANNITVFEFGARILYLTKPTVSVDSPTSTINQNVVTVEWTPSFDEHADSSSYYREVKVFSSAQYGAGGFDPDTSTATASSGTVLSGGDSHLFPNTVLLNGSYRAYVRVAAQNSADQWSDWDYEAFTVSVPSPGSPVLGLTGQGSSGRAALALTAAGTVSTDYYEVQTSTDGSSFTDLRTSYGGGSIANGGGTTTVYDYEGANGGSVIYRARAYHGGTPAFSDWTLGTVAWSSDEWWLKHPSLPSLNRTVKVRSYPGHEVQSNNGVFRPLGSSIPVVVSDVPGPTTGEVTFLTDDLDDREDLYGLFADASPLLLQGPPVQGYPDRWLAVDGVSSQRVVDSGAFTKHDETVSWTEVGRPSGGLGE